MQSWDTFQRAAMEYSRLRPRRTQATITLAVGVSEYQLPSTALPNTVTFSSYGDEGTFEEVMLPDNATPSWAVVDNTLFIAPAPTEAGTMTVIFSSYHPATGETFPTIPAAHISYVEDLEEAIILDLEADDVSRGPVVYAVGQTQVSREAALTDIRTRARDIRTRVAQALGEPLALWR